MEKLIKAGLKTEFDFRQAKWFTNMDSPRAIQSAYEFHVFPVVRELEKKGLINSFHFMCHKGIDLRLSCLDWDKNREAIIKVLMQEGCGFDETWIHNGLIQEWNREAEKTESLILNYNALEYHSRLIMAMFETPGLRWDLTEQRQKLGLWSHHLYNQGGFNNHYEAIDCFGYGFGQLSGAYWCGQIDSPRAFYILLKVFLEGLKWPWKHYTHKYFKGNRRQKHTMEDLINGS